MNDLMIKVAQKAEEMAGVDAACERGYAHLGWLLLEVSEMQYWRLTFPTFRAYLQSVADIAKRTPEQLNRYFLTVRDLCDTFRADELEKMGITKAQRLRLAKDYAIVLPQSIRQAALNPDVTVRELKKLIATTLRLPEEDGDWLDVEMEFVVTAEQRTLIETTLDIARHTEPLTKATISKSAQMLDLMLKLCMEYQASHCGDGL